AEPASTANHGRRRVRRKRGRYGTSFARQQRVHPFPQLRQLKATVRLDAVSALESQAQADVDQLDQVAVLAGAFGDSRQKLEDLLAAPGLVEEADQQGVRRPGAAAAPGRGGGSLVERGAEHVLAPHDRFAPQ